MKIVLKNYIPKFLEGGSTYQLPTYNLAMEWERAFEDPNFEKALRKDVSLKKLDLQYILDYIKNHPINEGDTWNDLERSARLYMENDPNFYFNDSNKHVNKYLSKYPEAKDKIVNFLNLRRAENGGDVNIYSESNLDDLEDHNNGNINSRSRFSHFIKAGRNIGDYYYYDYEDNNNGTINYRHVSATPYSDGYHIDIYGDNDYREELTIPNDLITTWLDNFKSKYGL